MVYTEGSVKICLPQYVKGAGPGKKAPVFYNPAMEISRTLSVCVLKALKVNKDARLIDLLSASGIRGIRYMVEAGIQKVIFNDISPQAVRYIKKNLKMNGLKAKVLNKDGREILDKGYEIIDLDPYGSPSPFLKEVSRSVKDFLMVSATDLPVLCGCWNVKCMKVYGAKGMRGEICKEVGLRILIGKIARDLEVYGKGLDVVYSYILGHHMRVFCKISKEKTRLGYVYYCKYCLDRRLVDKKMKKCKTCGKEVKIAGPLWIGPIFNHDFAKQVYKHAKIYKNAEKIARRIMEESKIKQIYYDSHILASHLKVQPPKIEDLVKRIGTRTHVDGIKFRSEERMEKITQTFLDLNSTSR